MAKTNYLKTYDGPIFDVQAHAIKPSALQMTSSQISGASFLSDATKHIIAGEILTAAADDLQGPNRLTALRQDGVQVVTVNLAFPQAAPEILMRIVEETNVWMAEKTSTNPQLIGTAVLPPVPMLASQANGGGSAWIDAGLAAMETAIKTLGLRGIMASSHYNRVFLGDPVYKPFFALAESLGVPIIIHPAIEPSDSGSVPRKNIPINVGYLNDQRTTLIDIVMSGVLDRHPNLTIVATHLGGGILTSIGRFEQLDQRFPDESWYEDSAGHRQELELLGSYFRRIYYDCNNCSRSDILHAVAYVGDDRLLTGTDFPWAKTDQYTRSVLGTLDSKLARKIAFDNAKKLFAPD